MASPDRIIRRYYGYRVTTSIGFYIPVGVLFLSEVRNFGLDAVGVIMAAYLVAMLVAEIPTGYLGDRLGRRRSLAVGNTLMAGSLVAWAFLQTPLQYVALNVVWATGTTFRSGTADAWLYEFLDAHDCSGEFTRYSGRANTLRLLVSAGAAIAAGALVAVDWALPFLANAALAGLGVPILATLPAAGDRTRSPDDKRAETADGGGGESDRDGNSEAQAFRVRDGIRVLRIQAGRPDVRWFVAYTALFYGLFQLGLAFEQPAVRAVGLPITGLGVLYAGFKLVSAGAAASAGRLEERLGARGVFALYAPAVGVVFASAAVWPLLLIPALFLNRGLNAVAGPIRNQYLNDRLSDVGRATVLSGASMVLSLLAAVADVVGGVVAGTTGPAGLLVGAGVATAGAAAVLWLAVSPVRPLANAPAGDVEAVVGSD